MFGSKAQEKNIQVEHSGKIYFLIVRINILKLNLVIKIVIIYVNMSDTLKHLLKCWKLLFSQGVTLTDLQEAEKTIGRSRPTRTREQENEEKEKEEKEKQDKEKQEEKKESETKDDDYRQRYSRTVEEVFS